MAKLKTLLVLFLFAALTAGCVHRAPLAKAEEFPGQLQADQFKAQGDKLVEEAAALKQKADELNTTAEDLQKQVPLIEAKDPKKADELRSQALTNLQKAFALTIEGEDKEGRGRDFQLRAAESYQRYKGPKPTDESVAPKTVN